MTDDNKVADGVAPAPLSGHRKFQELRDQMSPEAQERVKQRTDELIAEVDSVAPAPLRAPEKLDGIRERSEQATAGPWRAWHRIQYPGSSLSTWDQMFCSTVWGRDRQIADCVDRYWGSDAPEVLPEHGEMFPHRDMSPDAEFMAHARTDIPLLLAEIDHLRAALAQVTAEKGCEFCQFEPTAEVKSLDVCPDCWNQANRGSGWMQRALAAEAQAAEFKDTGQRMERDMRKHFEQGCINLKRAEAAEAELTRLSSERLLAGLHDGSSGPQAHHRHELHDGSSGPSAPTLRAQIEQLPYQFSHRSEVLVRRDLVLALLPPSEAPRT